MLGTSAGAVPVYAVCLMVCVPLSLVLYATTNDHSLPRFYPLIALLGFVSAIAWLNVEANELVSVLETFGVLFSIDTAILGLTVLAAGNSVGDWVAVRIVHAYRL